MRSVERWTPENLAWLAGIIEGEGCVEFGLQKPRPGPPQYQSGPRRYQRITVSMTDLDVIERVHHIASCGTITGPYWRPKSTKEIWVWTVQNRPGVVALLRMIHPWMGVRRRAKIEDLFAEYSEELSQWLS